MKNSPLILNRPKIKKIPIPEAFCHRSWLILFYFLTLFLSSRRFKLNMWDLYVVVSEHSVILTTYALSLCHSHTKGSWYKQCPVLSKSKEKVVGHSADTIMSSVHHIHSIPFHFLILLEIFYLLYCSGNASTWQQQSHVWDSKIQLSFLTCSILFPKFQNLELETVWLSGFTLFLWLSRSLCTLYLCFFPTKFTLCTTFIIFHILGLSI